MDQTSFSGWPVIIALLGSSSVSGVLGAAVSYFLFRPKHEADAHKTEAEADKTGAEAEKIEIENASNLLALEDRMRQIADEAARHRGELDRERDAHERDNKNNEFLLRLKNEKINELKTELAGLREDFYTIKTDLNVLQASEKTCQEKLRSLEQFQAEQEQRNLKTAEYADRAAQLTGLIRKAHKRGFLQESELDDAGVERA